MGVGGDDSTCAGFGHSPCFNQGNGKTGFKGLMQFGIDPCTKAKPYGMGLVFGRWGGAHQHGGHHPKIVETGRAGVSDI